MDTVSIRDLRNNGREVIDRVIAGEVLVVTRNGRPVAEIRPYAHKGLDAQALLDQWRHLPPIDYEQFRADVDEVIDQRIFDDD